MDRTTAYCKTRKFYHAGGLSVSRQRHASRLNEEADSRDRFVVLTVACIDRQGLPDPYPDQLA